MEKLSTHYIHLISQAWKTWWRYSYILFLYIGVLHIPFYLDSRNSLVNMMGYRKLDILVVFFSPFPMVWYQQCAHKRCLKLCVRVTKMQSLNWPRIKWTGANFLSQVYIKCLLRYHLATHKMNLSVFQRRASHQDCSFIKMALNFKVKKIKS